MIRKNRTCGNSVRKMFLSFNRAPQKPHFLKKGKRSPSRQVTGRTKTPSHRPHPDSPKVQAAAIGRKEPDGCGQYSRKPRTATPHRVPEAKLRPGMDRRIRPRKPRSKPAEIPAGGSTARIPNRKTDRRTFHAGPCADGNCSGIWDSSVEKRNKGKYLGVRKSEKRSDTPGPNRRRYRRTEPPVARTFPARSRPRPNGDYRAKEF